MLDKATRAQEHANPHALALEHPTPRHARTHTRAQTHKYVINFAFSRQQCVTLEVPCLYCCFLHTMPVYYFFYGPWYRVFFLHYFLAMYAVHSPQLISLMRAVLCPCPVFFTHNTYSTLPLFSLYTQNRFRQIWAGHYSFLQRFSVIYSFLTKSRLNIS